MNLQTAELTDDDMDNVSGGCPPCVVAAAAAAAAAAYEAARLAGLTKHNGDVRSGTQAALLKDSFNAGR